MTTKNITPIFVLFILLSCVSGYAQSGSFKARGNIKDLPDGEIYLAYGSFNTMKADTVQARNGAFYFAGHIDEPCYGMLFTHDYRVKIDLFLDTGTIVIDGVMNDLDEATVKGSAVVNEYAAYNRSILESRKPVQKIYEAWMSAYQAGDSVKSNQQKQLFTIARDSQSIYQANLQLNFIRLHPGSYISAWELMHRIEGHSLDQGLTQYNSLSPAIRESAQGREIAQRIALLSKVENDKEAPVFTQTSIDKKKVTLSDYRGKYLLLEFWASWCGPCRAETPNLVEQYTRFKDKGFDILSVSLDNDSTKWHSAIIQDKMPWTQVSDLKGWKNEAARLYGINGIPANFLLDPAGKIIAQNLRGEALVAELAKLLK